MREKTDSLGIKLTFYGALAFVLAIFGQTLLCGLLLGFSIVLVKDRWLCRQVMQAFFLCFVSEIISIIDNGFRIFRIVPILGNLVSGTISFVGWILTLLVLIFAIIALVRVIKGEEANLPIIKVLTEKAFGPEQ